MTKTAGVPLLLVTLVSCDGGRIPELSDAVQSGRVRYEAERMDHLDTLADARAAWATRVQSCRNYHYDRDNPAAGQQFIEKTTVQTDAGVPVWRSYFKGLAALGGPGQLITQWIERDAEVGAHDEGFPALTVEQLHDACEALVRDAVYPQVVTLSADPDGVPFCLLRGDDCLDRCDQIALSVVVCELIDPPAVRSIP